MTKTPVSALWLYFLLCNNGTIYIGTAHDPFRRFELHRKGRGALFTRLNPPISIVGAFLHPTRMEALRMERALKRAPTSRKRTMAMLAATSAAWLELKRGRNEN